MELTSVKKENAPLTEQVVNQIIAYIRENKLEMGDRLPNEKELTLRLSVSRCTLREAIRILSSRHIVSVERGRGTFVSGLTGRAEDPLGLAFMYDRPKVTRDLLELRTMLEPDIAACCALRASQQEKEQIIELAQKVELEILQGRDHSDYDVAFHCKIAECTQNDIIKILLPEITKGVQLFVATTGTRLLEMTIETHRQIALSIHRSDAEGARQAMQRHLEYNRKVLEEMVLHNPQPHNGPIPR